MFPQETLHLKPVLTGLCVASLLSIAVQAQRWPDAANGFWEWTSFVQSRWVYEFDVAGEPCQSAAQSSRRLSGDCDDFAMMIAFYAQVEWGYDSFIAEVSDTHVVAFVRASMATFNSIASSCVGDGYGYPYIKKRLPLTVASGTSAQFVYVPVDWEICPEWDWTSFGKPRTWEWHELIGVEL